MKVQHAVTILILLLVGDTTVGKSVMQIKIGSLNIMPHCTPRNACFAKRMGHGYLVAVAGLFVAITRSMWQLRGLFVAQLWEIFVLRDIATLHSICETLLITL